MGDHDARFMEEALAEAQAARAQGDVPVGAVVVRGGAIMGRGHNRREADADPTAHAEILAIRQAARSRGTWYLDGATLYVTLEPCAMCAGAIVLARIDRVVYGASDPKAGACGGVLDITGDTRLNHQPIVQAGPMREECSELIRNFFRDVRARGKM
ncbi:MAG: tRNA-specific adenosine deaminase [Armatimonadia bacterium]|nr:tRNA-specific adenosine deaminase [Armatimonadia bacterium]